MKNKQLNRKIAEIQEMPIHEVIKLRDMVSVSDANIATKDKLMEAISVRLSDNTRASLLLIECSEIDWEIEDEI